MSPADDRARAHEPEPDYTSLPPGTALEDTVQGVGTDRVLDPDDVRNVDQHGATRDD
jgi:hypothetical protein